MVSEKKVCKDGFIFNTTKQFKKRIKFFELIHLDMRKL